MFAQTLTWVSKSRDATNATQFVEFVLSDVVWNSHEFVLTCYPTDDLQEVKVHGLAVNVCYQPGQCSTETISTLHFCLCTLVTLCMYSFIMFCTVFHNVYVQGGEINEALKCSDYENVLKVCSEFVKFSR